MVVKVDLEIDNFDIRAEVERKVHEQIQKEIDRTIEKAIKEKRTYLFEIDSDWVRQTVESSINESIKKIGEDYIALLVQGFINGEVLQNIREEIKKQLKDDMVR